MAIRKNSARYWHWRAGQALSAVAPPLRRAMAFYEEMAPGCGVGETTTWTAYLPLRLSPNEADFAQLLPEALPDTARIQTDLIKLSGATVRGDTGRIVDEETGTLLHFSHMRSFATYHDVHPALLGRKDKPDGAYFNMVGSHRGHRHLFHFLLDRLPMLYEFIRDMPPGDGPVNVLTNEDLPTFQRDIYRLLAERHPRLRFVPIPAGERWRVGNLYCVDIRRTVKGTAADPAFLSFLRQAYFDCYGIVPEPSRRRRIFVSRLDTRKRRIIDEEALYPILARHGIEVIQAARLSYRDQVALFADAELIVGVHGAGLTNQVFAPQDCPVVEIFPRTKVKNTYFLLSHSLGQDYHWLIGGPGGRHEHFSIDTDAFEQVVSAALAERTAA